MDVSPTCDTSSCNVCCLCYSQHRTRILLAVTCYFLQSWFTDPSFACLPPDIGLLQLQFGNQCSSAVGHHRDTQRRSAVVYAEPGTHGVKDNNLTRFSKLLQQLRSVTRQKQKQPEPGRTVSDSLHARRYMAGQLLIDSSLLQGACKYGASAIYTAWHMQSMCQQCCITAWKMVDVMQAAHCHC